jgi:hypothetical protein
MTDVYDACLKISEGMSEGYKDKYIAKNLAARIEKVENTANMLRSIRYVWDRDEDKVEAGRYVASELKDLRGIDGIGKVLAILNEGEKLE